MSVREQILEGLASGMSLRAVCRAEGMPHPTTVLAWTESDEVFAQQYTGARARGYMLLADQIIDIADTPVVGSKTTTKANGDIETTEGDMIEHRKLQLDARKWMLSKMLPKVYGEKLEVTGSIDLAARMAQARERAKDDDAEG